MPKITGIELYVVHVPLRGRFETSHGASTDRECAVAVVRTDEGILGLGSVEPEVGYSDQDALDVVETCRRFLAPVLVGRDALRIGDARRRMEGAVPERLASKGLLEMALWDILGRAASKPVYSLLGGPVRDTVPLCGWVGMGSVQDTARVAESWAKQGFRAVKVKVGRDLDLDVERVGAVRAALGKGFEVRIDANEGYTVHRALRLLDRLVPFDIAHCEQPVPRLDPEGLAAVAARSPVPVMADESIGAPSSALRLLQARAAHRMKVKIMKQGGVLATREILGMAQAAGVPCTLGHGFGLTISTIAESHLALVTPNLLECSEMGGFLKVEDDVTVERPVLENGALVISDAPGLGITLDEERLKRYTVAQVLVHAQ